MKPWYQESGERETFLKNFFKTIELFDDINVPALKEDFLKALPCTAFARSSRISYHKIKAVLDDYFLR